METRGIFLMIWGKVQYGFMAHQLAMSLKHHSPGIPIYLLTDTEAVSRLRTLQFFDTVEYMDTPSDPAQAKIDMYNKLPFDHTIFLDADGLCLSEMESLFDQFIADEKPFRCFVYANYTVSDPPDLPLMVWARRDVIWDHYKLNGETLPATQSSLLYIRKGDFCEDLYKRMQSNYNNRIPLEKLKFKWGGGQPDELYLNVTLAQLGYDPNCQNVIYFADNLSLKAHQLKHQYKILSLFGTANNVKKPFERFYDQEVKTLASIHGVPVHYEWNKIKSAKHANTTVKNKRQAFRGGFVRSEKITQQPPIQKTSRTLLFTTHFDSGSGVRNRELKTVLENNINNTEIDHIYLWSETGSEPTGSKITIRTGDRPTYQMIIDWANEVSEVNDIVVIANSDIYFDQSLNWPHRINMTRTMIALSRWDVHVGGFKRLFAEPSSQDTWIFKGKIALTGIDYVMGIPGCDNRLAFDANKQGYRIANTAKDIITYHLHLSNVRSYTQENRIEGDYLHVQISSIRDLANSKLLIKQPGKVGDILICLPIAKHYHNQGYEVHWEAPPQYHFLFSYVDYVTPIVKAQERDYAKTIDLSFGIDIHSRVHHWWTRSKSNYPTFVHAKYELAGVPLSERSNLQYTRDEQSESALFDRLGLTEGEPYIIFHGQSDYGRPAPRPDTTMKIIDFAPVDHYTVFDWRKVIEQATEIHCIDSALANFVEVVHTDAKKVFYRIPERTTESMFDFTKWEMVDLNKLQIA